MVEVRVGSVDGTMVMELRRGSESGMYVHKRVVEAGPYMEWVWVMPWDRVLGVEWVDRFVVSKRPDVAARPVGWLSDAERVEVGGTGRWRWVVAAPPLTRWWNLAWLMWNDTPVLAVDLGRVEGVEGVEMEKVRVVEMMDRMGGRIDG